MVLASEFSFENVLNTKAQNRVTTHSISIWSIYYNSNDRYAESFENLGNNTQDRVTIKSLSKKSFYVIPYSIKSADYL